VLFKGGHCCQRLRGPSPTPPPVPFSQVQTNGEKTPIGAMEEALNGLATETNDVLTQFQAELIKHKSSDGGGAHF